MFHPASLQGLTMRGDWMLFIIVAAVVAAIMYVLILLPLFVWRERNGRKPASFSGNTALEITTAVIPLLIVAGLFVDTYVRETAVDRVSAHPEAVVLATAFRWSWRFEYPIAKISTVGTPAQPPTLYLPVNRTTEVDLSSVDVTHSFWVPAFLFKRDAIPGMTNRFDLDPDRIGTFDAKCAQFCGLSHALMTFRVRVVGDAAFDRYLASGGARLP